MPSGPSRRVKRRRRADHPDWRDNARREPAIALASQVPRVARLLDVRGITIRPIADDEAESIASWAYEPPFDIYDGDPGDPSGLLAIDDDGFGYYAVVRESDGEVIGFCCFGAEARVVGQTAEEGTVDIGGGVRPDLVGQGLATALLPALMEFACGRWAPDRFRTAVASFNERSTRLCLSADFTVTRAFEGPGREFQELVRPANE